MIVFRHFRVFERFVSIDFERLFHLLSSLETDASSEFVIFVAVDASSSIQRHYALLYVMLVCALFAELILSAELSHMIKFVTSEALCDATVLFK